MIDVVFCFLKTNLVNPLCGTVAILFFYYILLCLTPDDFTCQMEISRKMVAFSFDLLNTPDNKRISKAVSKGVKKRKANLS